MKRFLVNKRIWIFTFIIVCLLLLIIVNIIMILKKRNVALLEISNAKKFDIIYDNISYSFNVEEKLKEFKEFKIKYISNKNLTRIYLPDITKEYKVFIYTNENCNIVMNYIDYKISVITQNDVMIDFSPFGYVHLKSSNPKNWHSVNIESKNKINNVDLVWQKIEVSFTNKSNFKLYRYKNGYMLESDYIYSTSMEVYNSYKNSWVFSLYNPKNIPKEKIFPVWITQNEHGYIVALIDSDDDGIFDTDISVVVVF